MLALPLGSALLAAALLAAPSGRHAPPAPPVPPDRVVLVEAGDAEYRALAIPRAYKTAPGAPNHLLVFKNGLCIRDHGLNDANKKESDGDTPNAAIVEETGKTERGYVAGDGSAAVVASTRYVSRVDLTPGQTSTAGDTVTGDTSLTLVDPAHPDGLWRVTLENGRWIKDVVVLPAAGGVVLTSFVPRDGPIDLRILDAAGHESLRMSEKSGETVRIEAPPAGSFVAAEMSFKDGPVLPERGVIVFDLARGTRWTYGWRYGSDAEPLSWRLLEGGVLSVKLPGGTHRYDPTGRKL